MGSDRVTMPRKRDEESGKYTENYPAERFIAALREAEGNVAGTSEIAETVGCSDRLTLLRLDALAEEGRIQRRDIGRSNVWMLADAETDE